MALLQGPSPKQLEMIQQELGESPGDVERGVRELRAMCAASPDLPRPDAFDSNFLELFVRGCRLDMDRARTKLGAFCRSRARYADLYEHRSLIEPPLNDVIHFLEIVTLPKLTDEGLRVTIFRMKPEYPDRAADVAAAVRSVLLISDARMRDEKPIAGDVFIWEVSAARGSLVGRVATAASAIRRAIHLAHAAYPQRLKRVHIVSAPPFLASTLQLMRSFMNEKVRRRFLLHSRVEELQEHMPARILPAEWGGNEESMDIMARKWRHRVEELHDYLRGLNEVLTERSNHSVRKNDIYGVVGAFRKLDID